MLYQPHAKVQGCGRIVLGNVSNDLLQPCQRLGCEDYLVAQLATLVRTSSIATPCPDSNSRSAFLSDASSAASSRSDIAGSSWDSTHAVSAALSVADSLSMASWISATVLTDKIWPFRRVNAIPVTKG